MKIYDLAVVGGGPAGLIAAGRAAELGAKVLLLEKNQKLGVKLLMTGGGRCNFTNQSSPRSISESFGINGSWLLSGLSRFGPSEIIDFFQERRVKIQVEDDGRVFPQSNQAAEILQVLLDYAKDNGVEIRTGAQVTKIIKKENRLTKLILADQTEVMATNFIIATGGKSYPFSGSNGDAYPWLKALGHRIIDPKPALSSIIVKANVKKLEGLSLSGSIKLYSAEKKISEEIGDFIFTDCGLSGPLALNLSRLIARQERGSLKIMIDFFPNDTKEDLDKKIQTLIAQNKQAEIKNILGKFCSKRLANFILVHLKINPDKKGNGVTQVERKALTEFLQSYELPIFGLTGFGEAMITVGGVYLKEVDPKTMASKIIPNLYLAGEVLDLDGPTGGYNLQVAWTTGYLSGENASRSKC